MIKALYYNIIIAFKVWFASMDSDLDVPIPSYKWYVLDNYKQQLQWHYFGMPQHVKEHFYYKAMWEKAKRKAHDEWLKSIFNSFPVPESVREKIRIEQAKLVKFSRC